MPVINEKPQMEVDRTDALFSESTITYNDSSITYSSSSQIYAGSDEKQKLGQVPSSVILDKPRM